jgi:glycosyltransferase involved in cell wall biosynthesis
VAYLPAGHQGWLSSELTALGVWIEYFTLDHALSPAFVQWLSDSFRQYRIGLAHSHEFAMGVYGSWAARRAGIGHVITMHGSMYYAERIRRRVALRTAAVLSGGLVAVSNEYGRQLARHLWLPRSKVLTVLNGVPPVPRQHSTLREELGIPASDRIAISLGRLYPVKGHAVLVEAMALLAGRDPRLHLVVAGDGHLATALAEQTRALGLESRIHWLGLRSDIGNILGAADVFVLPSLSEALPLAMLEAMFADVPVVATSVGEVREVLDNGAAGVIVPPGDPGALASGVEAVLADPAAAKTMAQRAARRAAERYSLSAMVERYAVLYQQRLQHRPSKAGALTAV